MPAPMNIETILGVLNKKKIRASYGAVAELLGVHTNVVGKRLGPPRPEASWVVLKNTGEPSGPCSLCCHKDLKSNPRIVDTASELAALVGSATNKP